ncbi:MAG: molybdate ABC transporter substrate-binding protein [Pseudomonadota bacterium]
MARQRALTGDRSPAPQTTSPPRLTRAAGAGAGPGTGASPLVACASSLIFVMPAITAAFRAAGGPPLRISYGSSGNLARQMLQGAPFDLFLSADAVTLKPVLARPDLAKATSSYATGRLALVASRRSALWPASSTPRAPLADLRTALAASRIQRFAIAHPDHAPYGRAAREALTRAGLWEAIKPRLVYGESVAQAGQFIMTGAAQAGLLANALARHPRLARRLQARALPAAWHQPLDHVMVLREGSPPSAERLFHFIGRPQAQGLLRAAGFGPPAAP